MCTAAPTSTALHCLNLQSLCVILLCRWCSRPRWRSAWRGCCASAMAQRAGGWPTRRRGWRAGAAGEQCHAAGAGRASVAAAGATLSLEVVLLGLPHNVCAARFPWLAWSQVDSCGGRPLCSSGGSGGRGRGGAGGGWHLAADGAHRLGGAGGSLCRGKGPSGEVGGCLLARGALTEVWAQALPACAGLCAAGRCAGWLVAGPTLAALPAWTKLQGHRGHAASGGGGGAARGRRQRRRRRGARGRRGSRRSSSGSSRGHAG